MPPSPGPDASALPGTRELFHDAAYAFAELAGRLGADDWLKPGLGVWDVRELAGHASRSLSTIEAYLAEPAGPPAVHSPEGYFVAIRTVTGHEAIARRGQEAGRALGPEPARAIAGMAERATSVVDSAPDDATVATPVGAMRLIDYLPTRTFELTVHSLDLAKATKAEVPARLTGPVAACCQFAGSLAALRPEASDLLLLIAGRPGLPPDLRVV